MSARRRLRLLVRASVGVSPRAVGWARRPELSPAQDAAAGLMAWGLLYLARCRPDHRSLCLRFLRFSSDDLGFSSEVVGLSSEILGFSSEVLGFRSEVLEI